MICLGFVRTVTFEASGCFRESTAPADQFGHLVAFPEAGEGPIGHGDIKLERFGIGKLRGSRST